MARASDGTKGTCRYCERPVIYKLKPLREDSPAWARPSLEWQHTDTMNTHCELEDRPFSYAAPKEFCTYSQYEGPASCHRPVKHEDISAGLYACGIHMKKAVYDKERQESNRRHKEEQERRKEFDEWEADVYADFERSLRHWLGDDLFQGQEAVNVFSNTRRANRRVHIATDWADLHAAIIKLIGEVKSEVESGSVQGRDAADVSGVRQGPERQSREDPW